MLLILELLMGKQLSLLSHKKKYRNFSSKIKHTIAYLQEWYAMALQCASSSTRETHHKPTTTKWWINALVFQKTLLPLLWFEKMPCYPTTWWRKRGEKPQKTQEETHPHFSENIATTAMLLEKMPCYPANTMEKMWRKPTEKPRSKTPRFPENTAGIWKNALLSSHTMEETP